MTTTNNNLTSQTQYRPHTSSMVSSNHTYDSRHTTGNRSIAEAEASLRATVAQGKELDRMRSEQLARDVSKRREVDRIRSENLKRDASRIHDNPSRTHHSSSSSRSVTPGSQSHHSDTSSRTIRQGDILPSHMLNGSKLSSEWTPARSTKRGGLATIREDGAGSSSGTGTYRANPEDMQLVPSRNGQLSRTEGSSLTHRSSNTHGSSHHSHRRSSQALVPHSSHHSHHSHHTSGRSIVPGGHTHHHGHGPWVDVHVHVHGPGSGRIEVDIWEY